MKNFIQVLGVAGFSCVIFFACQKADPSPYSNPGSGKTNIIIPPTFSAEINSSFSETSFIPSKSTMGLNTTLKGVSTYYTITITFPSSTTSGDYTIGGFGSGFTAKVIDGPTTYVTNSKWGVGDLSINSISAQGKYSGTFNFIAVDTVTNTNDISVNQGSFSNM